MPPAKLNETESMDPYNDLHNSINADEWWDHDENKWNQFCNDTPQNQNWFSESNQIWALKVSPTPDSLIPPSLEPKSFNQAMSGPLSEHWKKAVDTELAAHSAMGTWTLVKKCEMPTEAILLGSRWVWKAKLDEHGKFKLARARVVCQGHRQRDDIVFHESLLPQSDGLPLNWELQCPPS